MNEDFYIKGNVLRKYKGNEENVVIPDNVEIIDEKAFRLCQSVVSIVVPDSVTQIRWGAFSFCPNLEKITIPSSVMLISLTAIEGSGKLKTIDMPNNDSYYVKDNCIYSKTDPEYVIKTTINGVLSD